MEMALSLRNPRNFGLDLVMPQNSVDLDNDEMEYVDGGRNYVTMYGPVITISFDENTTQAILSVVGLGAGGTGTAAAAGAVLAKYGVATFLSQPEVSLVAAVLTLDAAAIAAADNLDGHKGFTLNVLPSPFTYWIWSN